LNTLTLSRTGNTALRRSIGCPPERRERSRRPNHCRLLGQLGERLAAHHLEAKDYRIIERNHRTPEGEVDIIAVTGSTLAFVEVKCRRGSRMGSAVESLTPAKRRRMVALAEAYGWDRDDLPPGRRVDLIAIDLAPDGRLLSLAHYENAVTGDD
jgi:putative endonuclease